MQEDLKKVSPDNSSREYKFRVFLPKHNVTDTISMSEQMYYCDNFLKVHQATHCNSMDKINRPFYIMQYTGLKDKNGVEIYEGDVIKSLDVMGNMYRFDNKGNRHLNGDCGIGEIERLYCGLWYISGQVHNGLKELIDNGHEIEVIGNIYQNPELLSEK